MLIVMILNAETNASHHPLFLRSAIKGIEAKSIRKAIQLCIESANACERVLKDPPVTCPVRNFGNSAVELELRIWILDPVNGRANVISEVLLQVWDRFHQHGIKIPFPQRDLHINTVLGKSNIADVVDQLQPSISNNK